MTAYMYMGQMVRMIQVKPETFVFTLEQKKKSEFHVRIQLQPIPNQQPSENLPTWHWLGWLGLAK